MKSRLQTQALLLISCILWLTGCVSGFQRAAQIEAALQSPTELDKLCEKNVTGACALRGDFKGVGHELSIMQGVTSATQSRFTVLVPKKEKLSYYAKSSRGIMRLASERVERDSSPMAVDQVEAYQLDLKEKYELIVLDERGMAWERRHFRALDTTNPKARLALISCLDDSLKVEQAKMWSLLLSTKPDVILMIGDNVYADRIPGGWALASKEQLWDRYVDTRQTLDFYKTPDLVPVFATWDDHDFGRNDADRTYPFKEESQKVFQAFFAQQKPAPNFTRGPGVASWWSAYGVQFAFLDDRSFRSPNKMDIPDQTHFGSEQENWINDQLGQSKTPVALISGDQFFGGYHPFESFEGSHPKNFAEQMKRWKKAKVPLLFMSGDRHLTEIIKVPPSFLGYSTYELTSSSLHAKAFGGAFDKNPSPMQMAGADGLHNFMLIEILKASPKQLRLHVVSLGPDKQTLFEKNLLVNR